MAIATPTVSDQDAATTDRTKGVHAVGGAGRSLTVAKRNGGYMPCKRRGVQISEDPQGPWVARQRTGGREATIRDQRDQRMPPGDAGCAAAHTQPAAIAVLSV